MQNSLLISYYSLPFNSIASQRISRFARWLPYFNWNPVILSTNHGAQTNCSQETTIDSPKVIRVGGINPVEKIKAIVKNAIRPTSNHYSESTTIPYYAKKIDLIKKINPITNVRCPDLAIWWQKNALSVGLKYVAANRIDMIFSSCGPPSSHIVASKLSMLTNIPWVADYRDLWSLNHMQKRIKPIQLLEERYERHIMKRASHFTTVSNGLSRQLKQFFNLNDHITVIRNGFDEGAHPIRANESRKKFTIGYTGNIYPHQNPEPFIVAINRLKERKIIDRHNCRIRFYGINLDHVEPLAKKYGVADIVKCNGQISHEESLQRQVESDILLLFGWQKSNQRGIVTGKLFEYLGAGRPILCCGPGNDEIEAILQKSNAGQYCRNNDDAFNALHTWLDQWKKTGSISFVPNRAYIAKFSSKQLSGKLANVFDSVIEEKMAHHLE